MPNFLTSITDEIASCIQCAGLATRNIFQLIAFIGQLLWQSITFILDTILYCILSLADFCSMAKNDFVLFLYDVNDLYDASLKFVSDTGDFIFQVFLSCSNSFQQYWTLTHVVVFSVMECVSKFLGNILSGFKSLIILIGNSTLLLLQLGPMCLFSVCSIIFSVITWALKLVWDILFQTVICILAFFRSLHYEIIDIPPSSMFGMLLALIISFVFFYYLKSSIVSIIQSIQIKSTLILDKSKLHMTKFRRPGSLVELENSNVHLLRQLEKEREDKLCIVCHDQFKCVILLPCRHFCLCQTCASIILETDRNCPLCRRFLSDSMKVYT